MSIENILFALLGAGAVLFAMGGMWLARRGQPCDCQDCRDVYGEARNDR